jgi:hypothetical protein
VEVIIDHVTSGHMVQLENGIDEKRKIIGIGDPDELSNLAVRTLSL